NEITAHAVAAGHVAPEVRTVLEIGGQDSKIILLKDGIVVDFAMNSVCAAGTGSFLDHQSARLGIPIEEFGDYALKADEGAQIAGRCSVFAESDMIHKQQVGYGLEEIIYGLCQALVRNYLNNLAKGKDLLGPLVFQGGVAANSGMKRAFEAALNTEVIIPKYYNVMGAIGAALLAHESMMFEERKTNFKGFAAADFNYKTSSFSCGCCENNCEIIKIKVDDKVLARWGGRCGKWELDQANRRRDTSGVSSSV
ncbi:MAG TPA: 2-hydroxyglutaryl-CoA dehydratase, partial [Actinobacteria bacterium]|nr:2-hydroxyglutaryl-CoA dehydratase [Actinomycetes bacterium]HEX21696.1 2-hydroxyglutaryl-CoA dehydratase [Actinomycetota bacterium]